MSHAYGRGGEAGCCDARFTCAKGSWFGYRCVACGVVLVAVLYCPWVCNGHRECEYAMGAFCDGYDDDNADGGCELYTSVAVKFWFRRSW